MVLPATFQAVGEAFFAHPVYVFRNNSGTCRDSDAKIGTHQAEYPAHMCEKCWSDPINSDVTVTHDFQFENLTSGHGHDLTEIGHDAYH